MDPSGSMFFLVYPIFMYFVTATVAQSPEILYYLCIDNGNYSANSTYQTNLRHLLYSVHTNNEIDYGFYNFSYGDNSDKINAIGLCRVDIKPNDCRSCLNYSSQAIISLCPKNKEAIIGYERCMLRYSPRSILGTMEIQPEIPPVYNLKSVSDVVGFNKSLYTLLDMLRPHAAAGNSSLKFAIGKIGAPDFQTIYALLQCTPDLSESDCSYCLNNASGIIPQCCQEKQGATITLPSCFIRYEVGQFFYQNESGELPWAIVSPPSKGKNRNAIIIVVLVVCFVVIVAFGCICVLNRQRKNPEEKIETNSESADGFSTSFSLQLDLETIKVATNDFSETSKLGQGGFGVVYKGKFPNGQEVAVKRLSQNSSQGQTEFKNEVFLVAKLQHKNLVRLVGFCIERQERILVYEFMPNSSLDNYIFDPIKCLQLNWENRRKIIEGIARGLHYLHQESRLRIIHRDLKASNILLDEEMNAKIADFGMARLFAAADQTHDVTKRVAGTFGYMPPEYVKRGRFSMKSDVFSFGVLVLEILSGKKRSFRNGDEMEDLLTHAWVKWSQGKGFEFTDPTMKEGPRNEMMRCMHIGLLCVQENVVNRPTMASVIPMLSSDSLTLPIHLLPPLAEYDQSKSIHVQSTQNEVSISELYPR